MPKAAQACGSPGRPSIADAGDPGPPARERPAPEHVPVQLVEGAAGMVAVAERPPRGTTGDRDRRRSSRRRPSGRPTRRGRRATRARRPAGRRGCRRRGSCGRRRPGTPRRDPHRSVAGRTAAAAQRPAPQRARRPRPAKRAPGREWPACGSGCLLCLRARRCPRQHARTEHDQATRPWRARQAASRAPAFLDAHLAEHAGFHVEQQVAVVGPAAERVGGHAIAARCVPGGMSMVCLRTWKRPCFVFEVAPHAVQVDRVRHHRVVDEHDAHALAVGEAQRLGVRELARRRTTRRSAPCGRSGAARSSASGSRPSGSANALRRSA